MYWADQVRAAVREVVPSALVTIGFFEPHEPNRTRPGDTRLVSFRPAVDRSSIDFVNVHPYPGINLSFHEYMQNFGIDGRERKPIVMGEFGAFRFAFPNAAEAAYSLQDWQRESCSYGIDGWLLWTWDTAEQAELWHGTSDGGQIERGLSPVARPDPCAPARGVRNVALGRPTTASRFLAGSPPSNAVDGKHSTFWGSGDFPPQWIEVELAAPTAVSSVRLRAQVAPLQGFTAQTVLGRDAAGTYHTLFTASGFTNDGTVFASPPATSWHGLTAIRVETSANPGWVAWKEVEVVAAE